MESIINVFKIKDIIIRFHCTIIIALMIEKNTFWKELVQILLFEMYYFSSKLSMASLFLD